MEETSNRGPQLQLNRLYTGSAVPLHMRMMSEFDMTQEYNRGLYQMHPSKLWDLDLHHTDDDYMQLDPFAVHRNRQKGWEFDIFNLGSNGNVTAGNDWRQTEAKDSKGHPTSHATSNLEPRPLIHNAASKGPYIDQESNLLSIKLNGKTTIREAGWKPDRIVAIRQRLPCMEAKRNCFLQGTCEKCKKLRLVFSLHLERASNQGEKPLMSLETYCVRCLISTVNKKYFMDYLALESNWEEAKSQYQVIDELRLTTDLFRCQMGSNNESGHEMSPYEDDLAFVNYVIRERLTQVEKLNSQLTCLLANITKKINEKEKLLAFKVLHDNLSCIVMLHTLLMKRTLNEKFQALNPEEQDLFVSEIRLHISQMVSGSSYLSDQRYEQHSHQDLANQYFEPEDMFEAQFLGKRPAELSFEEEMQQHEHAL